jgi:glycerol-3-phosphate dehydrogenase
MAPMPGASSVPRAAPRIRRMFGYGFRRELDWLVKEEWAFTGGDVLWRRSKLGLHLDSDATRAIMALLAGCRAA